NRGGGGGGSRLARSHRGVAVHQGGPGDYRASPGLGGGWGRGARRGGARRIALGKDRFAIVLDRGGGWRRRRRRGPSVASAEERQARATNGAQETGAVGRSVVPAEERKALAPGTG